jgi:hypothetical protein
MLQVSKALRLLLNAAASRALPLTPAVTMTPCDAPSPRANGCVIAHPTKDEVHPRLLALHPHEPTLFRYVHSSTCLCWKLISTLQFILFGGECYNGAPPPSPPAPLSIPTNMPQELTPSSSTISSATPPTKLGLPSPPAAAARRLHKRGYALPVASTLLPGALALPPCSGTTCACDGARGCLGHQVIIGG